MIRINPTDMAAATGAALLSEGDRAVAGDVVIDSRRAKEGAVFVAFAGEKVDGNAYLARAAEAGQGDRAHREEPAPVHACLHFPSPFRLPHGGGQ